MIEVTSEDEPGRFMLSRAIEATILATLASTGLIRGCVSAESPSFVGATISATEIKAVDDILEDWERHASTLKTVDAEFTRQDHSRLFDVKTTYRGRYTARGLDQARVSYEEIGADGGAHPHEDILRTNGKIYQSISATRTVHVLPVADWGEDTKGPDTFLRMLSDAVGMRVRADGPVFFFLVRKDDLKASYQIRLLNGSNKVHTLELTPKTTRLRSEFARIVIESTKETYTPKLVRVYSSDKNSTTTYAFAIINLNPQIEDGRFREPTAEGWKVKD